MLRRNSAYRTARLAWVGLRGLRRYRALGRRSGPSDPEALLAAHERTARELHDLTVELEGLFIKLAQVIGARQDLVPEPYVRHLGRFHDRVPPRPFRDLERAVRRELGRPLSQVFSDVDPEPLASASLAQVHRGTLRDGSEVVLKIQYPEIERLIQVDLAGIRRLSRRMASRFDGSIFDMQPLVDETSHFLELELDFQREAESTERMRRGLERDERVRIPRVHPEHSSRKLLVLEYLEGTPLTDAEALRAHADDLPEFARRIAELYAAMIFEQGFFHGDPHPGNVLLLPGNVVGLLDFGLAKELPEKFGAWMAALIVYGFRGDRERSLEAARALGFNIDELSPALLAELLDRSMGSAGQRAESPAPEREQAPRTRGERRRDREHLRRLASGGAQLRVPHHFALIGRTMMLLNGLSDRLAPGQRLVQQTMQNALVPYAAAVATAPPAS